MLQEAQSNWPLTVLTVIALLQCNPLLQVPGRCYKHYAISICYGDSNANGWKFHACTNGSWVKKGGRMGGGRVEPGVEGEEDGGNSSAGQDLIPPSQPGTTPRSQLMPAKELL